MGEDWKYYNVEDYNTWKRKQGKDFRSPPRANYIAAANHIKDVLDAKKLSWAAMCGLAMLCLGSRRDMPDIHIVYDDRDFQRIKTKLEADKRVSLPKGMVPLFPAKILIATGPRYKDASCIENAEVEVDLVPPGINGAPTIENFRKNQVLLRLNLDGKMDNFRGLNMLYLVKTMLQYCKSQELVWDPKKDLTFLCQNYASEIQKIRQQLNQKEIQEMYLSTSYFAKLSPEDQRKSYNVLLDKDPPPLMSITPPPPQVGQKMPSSAPGSSLKPPLLSQKSSPALSTGARPSSTFLSPPKPGKPKSRPAQPLLNASAKQPMGTGPHAQLVPIYSTAPDSRSRYRATSAPDASNAGMRKSTQLAAPASSFRPMSMDSRGPQPQANSEFYSTARAVSVQTGPKFSRPQVTQVRSHAHASQSAKAMGPIPQQPYPGLGALPTAQVPLPTSSHKIIPPGPRASYIPPQSGSYTSLPAGTANGARIPAKEKPPQASKGGPQGHHINDRARLPNPSGASQLKSIQMSAQGNIPRPGQPPQQQHSKSVPNESLSSTPLSVGDSPGPAVGLRLVGPEGVYSPPTKPSQPKRPAPAETPGNTQPLHTGAVSINHRPITTQATFAFELDASPAQRPMVRSVSPQELPTDPVVSVRMQPSAAQASSIVQSLQQIGHVPSSQPVAPPELAHLAHDVVSPLSPPISAPAQTLIPLNEPFPAVNMPMSLMVGGAARQRSSSRSPQSSPQRTPQHSPQPSQNMQTNAWRYTSYYSPSSSPNNGQTQPYAAPTSAYKAYSGPISPPVSATTTVALPKVQTFGASQPSEARAQDIIYAARTALSAQYTSPDLKSQSGNLTPPKSPPQSQYSYHSPQEQTVSTSNKKSDVSTAGTGAYTSSYTAFSYRNSGELHLSTQPQTQPQSQAPIKTEEPVWFSQPQPQTQQQQNPQLPPHPSPQNTNEQLPIPPPTQWTHPALQNHNHTPSPPQLHPIQPVQQPPLPLSHANITTHDSPTTPQHTRSTSHDSDILAQEYQSELPVYGERTYGSGELEQKEFEGVQRSDSGRPQDAWRQSVGMGREKEKRISEQYEFIDFT